MLITDDGNNDNDNDNTIVVIDVDIPKFEEKYSERKSFIIYHIELTCHITQHKWHIEKQYDDFKTLYTTLKHSFPNVPPIPFNTFFKLTDYNHLTQRKDELRYFLQTCIQHKDILSSIPFRTFINIDTNAPEVIGNTHLFVSEYAQLPFGVRDFICIHDKALMFLCCSDINIISRAYSTNFTLSFETQSNAYTPLGAVHVYKILQDDHSGYSYTRLWKKDYPCHTGVISFDTESEVMCVGLDNGKVYVYQHNKSDTKYCEFIEVCEICTHKDKVIGVAYDHTVKCVYSCSSDKTLYCHDMNQTQIQSHLICTNKVSYTSMKFIKCKGNVYLVNESGMFSIYTVATVNEEGVMVLPKRVISIQTSIYSCVRGFDVYDKCDLVFMGMNNGMINVLKVNECGKSVKELTVFNGDMKIRVCKYNEVRNELITGDDDGRVIVWCLSKGDVVYCWTAHENSAVMQIWWDKEGKMLWTGGKDKKIKLWKLPDKWDSKAVEEYERKDITTKNINKTIAIKKMKDDLRPYEDDDEINSSGDELCGWDLN